MKIKSVIFNIFGYLLIYFGLINSYLSLYADTCSEGRSDVFILIILTLITISVGLLIVLRSGFNYLNFIMIIPVFVYYILNTKNIFKMFYNVVLDEKSICNFIYSGYYSDVFSESSDVIGVYVWFILWSIFCMILIVFLYKFILSKFKCNE